MKKGRGKKLFCLILAVIFAFMFSGVSIARVDVAASVEAFSVNEVVNINTIGHWTSGNGWSFARNVLTVQNGANIAITGTVANGRSIAVAENAAVNIELRNIDILIDWYSDYAPLLLNAGAQVNLNIVGENYLLSEYSRVPAIEVPDGAAITIGGSGVLNLRGSRSMGDIGSTEWDPNTGMLMGDVTVNSGTINANSDGGWGSRINGDTVTINGGNVNSNRIFGQSAVVQNGGTVVAGTISVHHSRGEITINGGTLNAASISGSTVINNGTVFVLNTSWWGSAIDGSLVVNGGKLVAEARGSAVISGTNITINGGTVSAVNNDNNYDSWRHHNGIVGNVNIEGNAVVTATGGRNGAGIRGNVTIGGNAQVNATGGIYGAGIAIVSVEDYDYLEDVYFQRRYSAVIGGDAVVVATGGRFAAGIGGYGNREPCFELSAGNIVFEGRAHVTANAGENARSVGSGYDTGNQWRPGVGLGAPAHITIGPNVTLVTNAPTDPVCSGELTGWTNVAPASCRNGGAEARSCVDCGTRVELRVIEETTIECDWQVWDIEPTCIRDGFIDRECSVCWRWKYERIPALGHIIVYGNEYTAAHPCSERNVRTGRCQREDCAFWYTTFGSGEDSIEHTPGGWVIQVLPTCGAAGRMVRNCTVCGEETDSYTLPALGHNMVNFPRVEPTCVTSGNAAGQRCNRAGCGHVTGGGVIRATGHNPVARGNRTATFFAAGVQGRTVCQTCNTVVNEGRTVARRTLARPRVTLRAVGNRTVRATSSRVANANRYQFQFRRQGDRTWRNGGTISGRNRNITRLTRGRTYEVRGRAVRVVGRQRAQSGWSAVRRIRVR